MSYYPEADSHIRDKVKIVLNFSNYTTKKELDDTTDLDTSDLSAKKDFIAWKAEVDKLDINKLLSLPTSLNNLKTNEDDSDVDKLKTVPVDLKSLSDVVDNEVVKNTKCNTLKIKVNNLEKKIPDETTLIHINQHNTDKQNLEKKTGYVDKIYYCWKLNAKCITIQEFNKFTAEKFAVRLKQVNIVSKTYFDNKLISFNRKIISNKKKYLEVPKKINSLITKNDKFCA